jgi:hypothetical protein
MFGPCKVDAPADGVSKAIGLGALSTVMLKQWSGKPVDAADVQQLVRTKTSTLAILEPYLQSSDAKLHAEGVAALASIASSETSIAPRHAPALASRSPNSFVIK